MLKSLDARAAQAFGKEMAQDVVKLLGKIDAGTKNRDKHLAKLKRLLGKARTFSATERLNVYKKARLGQSLRDSLLEAGYPKDFAEEVVRITLTMLQ
jgi:hypothetical protein